MGLGFSEDNWNECLEALGFTEQRNISFGGMVIFDDKGIPVWDYDNLERKMLLYYFFSGAVYGKMHFVK